MEFNPSKCQGVNVTSSRKTVKTDYVLHVGLLRVSEYSDIRRSKFKIKHEYSSLPKSLDRDFFFFLTKTRSFSQNGLLKFFTMTTVLISHSNTFVSCRLVTSLIHTPSRTF